MDLNQNGLDDTMSLLRKVDANIKGLSIIANTAKEGDVDDSIAKTVGTFGRIDHCVNAAGIAGAVGGIEEIELNEYERLMDVNLKGVWLCERAQIRQFLKQKMRPVE